MDKKGISQEGLKLLACVTMLIDHIGAVLVPYSILLRVIGRIAFPIYCFLMAEGAVRTRNPRKYALRLFVGMLLAELPFDMAFWGGWTWAHQSVMVTLLLGYGAVYLIGRSASGWQKALIAFVFFLAAEFAHTDYGGFGVLMIILFSRFRQQPALMTGALLLVCLAMGSFPIPVGPIAVPIEAFAVLAMIPIAMYSGRKATHSRAVQWAFYLFYPVHLTILALIDRFG